MQKSTTGKLCCFHPERMAMQHGRLDWTTLRPLGFRYNQRGLNSAPATYANAHGSLLHFRKTGNTEYWRGDDQPYSVLMFAALMIGHHFSISALCKARSASGVCWSRGKISCPRSARRARRPGSAKAATAAALSLAMMSFGVPFGTQRPCHIEA